jgi:hypothetical protein
MDIDKARSKPKPVHLQYVDSKRVDYRWPGNGNLDSRAVMCLPRDREAFRPLVSISRLGRVSDSTARSISDPSTRMVVYQWSAGDRLSLLPIKRSN